MLHHGHHRSNRLLLPQIDRIEGDGNARALLIEWKELFIN